MSPPAAYIVPSATMQTSPQAKTFPACSNLLSLCPMTKVCGIFSEDFFPPNSGGQQRATRPSKTQSPATGPQTATLFLRLRDSNIQWGHRVSVEIEILFVLLRESYDF